ncbi:hypothetical protein BOX15_Mlig029073g1, partial [Macrostomum lignano]
VGVGEVRWGTGKKRPLENVYRHTPRKMMQNEMMHHNKFFFSSTDSDDAKTLIAT